MRCSKDPLGGCPECSHVQEGSCFDGVHLYCELFGVWTSLMGGEWLGYCLDPEKKAEAGPWQPSLF